MTDYRLEQVADYLCTIELALVKYEAKEDGETYNKFFGGIGSFKRNWLKPAASGYSRFRASAGSGHLSSGQESQVARSEQRWRNASNGVAGASRATVFIGSSPIASAW